MHCSRVHTNMRFVLKEIESLGFLVLHIVTESHKINVAAVERVVLISSTAYRIPKAQTAAIFVFRSASFDNKREIRSLGESPWQK